MHKILFFSGLIICFAGLNFAAPVFAAAPTSPTSPAFNPTPIHEAFATKFTDIVSFAPISREPPLSRVEMPPPQPYGDAIWIPGYFAFVQEMGDFEWICGVWRRPPPNHIWVPGYWNRGQDGFSWIRGFWSREREERLIYISKAPPLTPTENVPTPPDNNSFWAPGYWNYTSATSSYTWLSGAWTPFDSNWVLAPAHYEKRPEGYIFLPFYWDHPIDKRGTAYSCTEQGGPIPIEPQVIVQRLFFYYPDHLCWYWHWWHYHPAWWSDCWCLPPWWEWNSWWGLGWNDCWWLWWWWGHPGFASPWWLSPDFALKIAPPLEELLDFLDRWRPFPPDWLRNLPDDLKRGFPDVRPTGPRGSGGGSVPLPPFPGIGGGGRVQVPPMPPSESFPPPRVTIPPTPSYPSSPPSGSPPASGTPPYGPRPLPPPAIEPPTIEPPETPPTYVPPPRRDWPDGRYPDGRPGGHPDQPTPPREPPRQPPPRTPPTPPRTPPQTMPPGYIPPVTPPRTPPRTPPQVTPPQYTPPRSPNYPGGPRESMPNVPNFHVPSDQLTPRYSPPQQDRPSSSQGKERYERS